jgi:hypothetical protein
MFLATRDDRGRVCFKNDGDGCIDGSGVVDVNDVNIRVYVSFFKDYHRSKSEIVVMNLYKNNNYCILKNP